MGSQAFGSSSRGVGASVRVAGSSSFRGVTDGQRSSNLRDPQNQNLSQSGPNPTNIMNAATGGAINSAAAKRALGKLALLRDAQLDHATNMCKKLLE